MLTDGRLELIQEGLLMGDGAIEEEFLNSFYCPGCGRPFAEHLEGEAIKPCERCRARLRFIVHGTEFSIIGNKVKKNRHKR